MFYWVALPHPRRSSSFQNFLTDVDVFLTDYESPGVSAPDGTQVHSGFLEACVPFILNPLYFLPHFFFIRYNSVADTVISTVNDQLTLFPGYSVVTTGHSLGGALSSLAAASLKGNFPSTHVTMYTYGGRTGFFLRLINSHLGTSFRTTKDRKPNVCILDQSTVWGQ